MKMKADLSDILIICAVAVVVIGVVIKEIAGPTAVSAWWRRLMCPHPPEDIQWERGARYCNRCGKEVMLWEPPAK